MSAASNPTPRREEEGCIVQIGHAGLVLLESSEGFSSRPYWDSIGRAWTRGYGRTFGITGGSPSISRAQGERELIEQFNARYGPSLKPFANKPGFTQNMYDALASFVWNCGTGAVSAATTIGRHLRAGNWSAAANDLLAWCKASGRVIQGLLNRRKREKSLFLKKVVVAVKAYLTPWERRTCYELEAERRTAKRHGGWAHVDSSHLKHASRLKADLRARVSLLKSNDQSKLHRRERVKALLAAIG